MTEVKLDSILSFRGVVSRLTKHLVPFAQSYVGNDLNIPSATQEAGFCGQTGEDDPLDNRGVTGLQITRGFYNVWFRVITSLTIGLDAFTAQLLNLYDAFIADYAHNDRRYDAALNYNIGDVAYQDYDGFVAHGTYNGEGWDGITLLHERGKTVLYEPAVVLGTVPDWAIDIGTGETYDFATYPMLENNLLKGVIESLSAFGASWTIGTGFTAPDLRGMSPGLFLQTAGSYLAHNPGQHSHVGSSFALGLASLSVSHAHPGADATHGAHTHSLRFRLGYGHITDPEEHANYFISNNGNDKKSWTVHTSGAAAHAHTITVGDGTESHKHGISGTLTSGTANAGHHASINRVSTYPVHFIVRFE